MLYAERRPPPCLAPWIERIWTLRGTGAGEDPVLPDGRTEIILNFGDPFQRVTAQGTHRQSLALFVGPAATAVVLRPEGGVDLMGIRLRPGAAAAALGLPMDGLIDAIPALDGVAPRLAGLLERVGNDDRRDDAVLDLLAPLLLARPSPDARVIRALGAIERRASIDAAARAACLSTRQLERRFRSDVGLSPKTYSRVIRVQAAARAAPLAGREGWARVAIAAGFYDQAHLIRDFRAVAGTTPTTFFGGESTMGVALTSA